MKAPLPFEENKRLEALQQYQILDTAPEQEFDDLTHLAAQICGTPVSLISLVDQNRQWFKSKIGMEATEIAREVSFCAHAILDHGLLLVPDASADVRFATNPLVTSDPHIRFYAGMPLATSEGQILGTLCVMDTVPRHLNTMQQDALRRLGRQVISLMERKFAEESLRQSEESLRQSEAQLRDVMTHARCLSWSGEVEGLPGWEKAPSGRPLLAWHLMMHNEQAAQQVISLDVLPGSTYLQAWADSRLPADAIQCGVNAMNALLRGDDHVVQEYRCADKYGHLHWLHEEFTIQPMEPERWKVFGVCTDITERKQADERIRRLIASDIQGVLFWNKKGEITGGNDAFLSIAGYTREDLETGHINWLAMTPPEYAYLDQNALEEIAASGACKPFEKEVIRKDGSRVTVLLGAAAFEDAPDEGVCFVLDVTERKQAEAALRASEERFQVLEENSWDVVHLLSDEGVILYESPSVIRVLGYQPEELVGRSSFELVHPDDLARVADLFAPLISTPGLTLAAEVRVHHKDGSWPWMDCVATNLLEHPAVRAIAVNYRDITERKHVEQALRESEEHFRFLNDLVEAARTLADPEQIMAVMAHMLGEKLRASRCAYADVEKDSEAFTILHDYTDGCASTVGHYQLSLFGARAVSTLYSGQTLIIRNVDDELSAGEGADTFNAIGIKAIITCPLVKDGVLRAMMAVHQTTPRDWKPSEIAIVQDVVERCWATIERRTAEEKVHQLNAELEQRVMERTAQLETANQQLEATNLALHTARETAEAANLAKSEFLSRMSHELRTPLNAILGFGQVLEMHNPEPFESESISHILKGGRHLLALINEVLDIARVEAGGMEFSLEPVAVREIVDEAASLIRPLAGQNGIRLDTSAMALCDAYTLADQQRLKQVLINLLSNAVKYNRHGGSVTVSCVESAPGRIRIEVTDTGPGIAAQDLDKLFVPFERLGAEKSEVEGTGLGLAFSQRLVEAMGGTLTVASVTGQGSTFTVGLPGAEKPAQPEAGPGSVSPPEERRTPTITKTVLSIEDNASNYRLIEAILTSRPGIKLLSAMQGQVGLDLAFQHHPDLILLDLHLPDIMGDEVLRRLRASASTQDTPVIILSADATPRQIERLLEAGANSYLTKPLDVKRFLQVLEETLQEKRS